MAPDRLEVLDRFEPLFEAPEPSFERFVRRHDHLRRRQRITAGVVGIAVFVAAIWIVTAGGTFDRTHTPATTGPTGPTVAPNYPGRIGLIGLAPEDAILSSPRRGELVVALLFGHTGGDPGRFGLHVYEDGRVIWEKLGEGHEGGDRSPTGLIEQRLTSEGVELVRSEVLSTGLFARDAHLVGGYVPFFGEITVRDGDRLIRVSWGSIGPESAPDVPATPEQAEALQRLDARIEDLESWLPAGAWEDSERRPFVPSRYSFCLETDLAVGERELNVGFDRVLASLPGEAEDMVRAWDLTYRADSHVEGWYWCSAVTAGRARALAEVLDRAGVFSNRDVFGLVYDSGPLNGSDLNVSISFEPMLPHGP